jgi:FHS family L-fucose permease-like MFS transporter
MNYRRSLTIVTLLFFLFGFITCLNDILIPHLKGLFTLNYTQAMLVQVCFFSAYFVMSIPSGWFTDKYGYRAGIVSGLLIAALGTLGFLPAAQFGTYSIFLISLFVLASGITLLQVSVNPYVTLLGDPSKSAFRLNLVQAFNSLGTTLAPLVGSYMILESVDKVAGIQVPYVIIATALAVVAIGFFKIKLPTLSEFSHEASSVTSLSRYTDALKNHPHLWLGMLSIFCYVGAEVSIGSLLVSWMSLPEVAGFDEATAGKFVSFYWGGAMIGRFIGAPLTANFKPQKVLFYSTLLAALFATLAIIFFTPGLSLWLILAIGLFNSIQFPTIFSLSVAGLGKDTPHASGLLCTCIVGGALIPLLQGSIADLAGLRISYLVPIACYLYLAWSSDKLSGARN